MKAVRISRKCKINVYIRIRICLSLWICYEKIWGYSSSHIITGESCSCENYKLSCPESSVPISRLCAPHMNKKVFSMCFYVTSMPV